MSKPPYISDKVASLVEEFSIKIFMLISAEDPYASKEKDQQISMIHILVKREEERVQENHRLKDMVKELRDTNKLDMKTQTNLLKSIDKLTI